MPESIRNTYQYHTCAETAKVRAAGFIDDITTVEEAVGDYVRNYLFPVKRLGE